ncbi:MAG: HAMP domain-containing protein [Candidatus Omnitrophica bacterium]|nr:HAMP domain-containing protein [Candidatus Omnitrophota bacterium]
MTNPIKHKTGIKKKLVLSILLLWLFVLTAGIGTGYFLGVKLVREVISSHHSEMAQMISGSIDRIVNEELQDFEVYMSHSGRLNVVKQRNLIYKDMSKQAQEEYFKNMDEKWISMQKGDALFKEYLENPDSKRLKEIVSTDEGFAEIFLTDKYGGLVLASDKTSDYYQADEEWWQRAYNNGQGSIFIGDVEFDESAQKISISLAIPLKDKSGEIIGVAKGVLDFERLFAPLEAFEIGKTGRAVLINEEGYVLFHEGITPLSTRYFSENEFKKLQEERSSWLSINNSQLHAKKMIATCSEVSYPFLVQNGVNWHICVSQEEQELFAPLNMLFIQLIALSFILILVIVLIVNIFATLFVKPIKKLHEATEKIAGGDLDYIIDIQTDDEIEQLADSFEYMVSVLKDKQDSLRTLSNSLEKKVQERTEELSRVNEATLNILEDLTEANKKIEEALVIKSEFASMVSHELRTPLTAIKEGIGIVLDGSAGQINADQKDFLETAKRNVDRLARLINDVLDFQKLESGKMQFNMQENDLNKVVQESFDSMKPLAGAKNIKMELDLAKELPKVNFDKDKITQAVDNLVNNAIKYTDKGSIRIETKPGNNIVEFSIKDTGVGIKDKDMPKLFQSFQQLGEYHERKVASSCLGLSISKEIIERHRGKIWVESEFGKGSTFHFILPIKERRV